MYNGKKATLRMLVNYKQENSYTHEYKVTHPELNCFNGGRMTAFLPMTQNRPVLTLAKSPRIIAPVCTITLPFNTIFWEPHITVCRLTLLPEAFIWISICFIWIGNDNCWRFEILQFLRIRLYCNKCLEHPFDIRFTFCSFLNWGWIDR